MCKGTNNTQKRSIKAKELALQHAHATYQEALASNDEVLSVCKADANVALQHWKAQQLKRHNEDMASYQEECATLIQKTLNTRILRINLMYNFFHMLLYMYGLLYVFICDL